MKFSDMVRTMATRRRATVVHKDEGGREWRGRPAAPPLPGWSGACVYRADPDAGGCGCRVDVGGAAPLR